MRKITNAAQKAFWDNGYFKQDNTTVVNGTMQLYKTMIALWCDGLLTLHSGGYRTMTTKERLNGVLARMGYQIRQRKGKWFVYRKLSDAQTGEFKGWDKNGELFYDGMQFRI